MYLKYSRIRDVKHPVRGHKTDAGIDLFVPNDFKKIILRLNDSILIPSGIKFEIPIGMMGVLLNKSSIATNKKLLIGAQVIDSYYSGEVHINLHNVGNKLCYINPGDKIVQIILVPIYVISLIEEKEEKLYSDSFYQFRGNSGFGSTGEK